MVFMRIVSLLPSATEMVCALGLEDQLIGVSHECDYPESVKQLPHVTRSFIPADAGSGEIDRLVRELRQQDKALYALDHEQLQQLQPDLIVTQALCDVCAVAESEVQTAARNLPSRPAIINLEPQTLGEMLESLRDLARAAGAERQGEAAIGNLQSRVDAVTGRFETVHRRQRVALLEWLDPPFSSGHWTPEIIRLAGGEEVLGKEGERSKRLAWEAVTASRPEFIFIACCGFDVERTKQDLPLLDQVEGWQELPAVRNGQVYIIDGSQYFSRPGPRLVDSLEMIAHVLHPEVHALPHGLPQPLRIGDS